MSENEVVDQLEVKLEDMSLEATETNDNVETDQGDGDEQQQEQKQDKGKQTISNDDGDQENQEETKPNTRVYVGNLAWATTWQSLKDHFKQCGEVSYTDVFKDRYGRSKGCGIVQFETVEEAQTAIAELTDTMLDERKIFVREDREPTNRRNNRKRQKRRNKKKRRDNNNNNHQQHQQHQQTHANVRHTEDDGEDDNGDDDDTNHDDDNDDDDNDSNGGGSFSRRKRYDSRRVVTSGNQLFVGNLPYETSEQDLIDAFGDCGKIKQCSIKKDKNGKSRGFATILFDQNDDAESAITQFDATDFNGRHIKVYHDQFV